MNIFVRDLRRERPSRRSVRLSEHLMMWLTIFLKAAIPRCLFIPLIHVRRHNPHRIISVRHADRHLQPIPELLSPVLRRRSHVLRHPMHSPVRIFFPNPPIISPVRIFFPSRHILSLSRIFFPSRHILSPYSHPQRQTYSEPTYPQPQRQTYSEPSYTARNEAQYNAYSNNESAYVDYDREASEVETKPKKKKHESSYSLTGVIVVSVLGVLLVPTMGFAIYYLVRGLYELLRAFPGTGVALIAAGGSLSANSLWICLGLIFIGISFLALTGLLIMAIIEITRLFIKLFRYVLKECKKMIKEGSF